MNFRWLVVLLLVALLAGFLGYIAQLAPPAQTPAKPQSPNAANALPQQNVAGQFTSSGQCAQCHQEIFREWQEDQHATAWTDPPFKTFSMEYNRVECLPCHAPEPMLETGITKTPVLRAAGTRASGVDCLTCHIKDGRTHGTLGSNAACGGVLEPALKTSQACFHCHSTHNLFIEYEASDFAKQGLTCQDCHMQSVERPVAVGGPVRKTRKHFIHAGAHDPAAIRKALKLEIAIEGREAVVTVTNIGAAHGLPGEINNRQLRLQVLVNKTLGQRGGETDYEETGAFRECFQPPPRLARNKIPSTQLLPNQPRSFRYKLPDGRGRIEALLHYKLEASEMGEGEPVGERAVDF